MSDTKPSIAKINRKLIQRTIVLIVILGAVAYGAFWLLSKHADPDLLSGPANTSGDIAAVQAMANGYRLDVIKPDGTILFSPEYVDGADDENPTWRPDGGRLFFESDRYKLEPHLYSWNPDTGLVERRTVDKRPKGFLSFAAPGSELPKDAANGLMISGGTVIQIDANSGQQKQLLPPNTANTVTGSGGENGAQSSMELYVKYGSSFNKAMWTKNKHYIVAIMDRDSGDQALVIQDMTNPKAPPEGIVMGKHVSFDIGPVSGRLVFSVQGFEVPDWLSDDQRQPFVHNGKLVPPYYAIVEVLDLENHKPGQESPDSGPMVVSPTNATVFGDPAISPDESLCAVPVGVIAPSGFVSKGVAGMPIKRGGGPEGFPICAGNIGHLSWTPDGSIVGILNTGVLDQSDVIKVQAVRNGAVQNLTMGKGMIFTNAVASPQK